MASKRQRRRDARLEVEAGAQIAVEAVFANATDRAAGEKRLEAQVAPLPQWRQTGEIARRRGAIDRVGARHRRPIADFILPADAPGEVDTPGLSVAGFEASVLNGMRNSAIQPSLVVRASTHHTASQLGLTSRPSLAICVSALAPSELVENTKPLRRSANVSKRTSNVS